MFNKRVLAVLKGQVSKVADTLQERGIESARTEADQIISIEGLGQVIRSLYVFVGIASARRVLTEIKRSAKQETKAGFGFDEVWNRAIQEYFKLFLLTKAVLPISAEMRRLILEVIDKGVTEGWGIDRMVQELMTADFPQVRARLITRTEIVKAQFYGEELGIESSEWESNQMWISAHDHRVRSAHRKVDGETIPVGGRFKVDRIRNKVVIGYDMMKGPGDPEAHIENLANCRCVRSVVAARDERGRLIRKSKKLVDLHREFAMS